MEAEEIGQSVTTVARQDLHVDRHRAWTTISLLGAPISAVDVAKVQAAGRKDPRKEGYRAEEDELSQRARRKQQQQHKLQLLMRQQMHHAVIQRLANAPGIRQRIRTDGLRTDPFCVYPIQNETAIPETLDFYFSVYCPENDESFPIDTYTNTSVTLMYPKAAQKPISFQGIITLARAAWLRAMNRPPEEDLPFLMFRKRTLAMLRESVHKGTNLDDWTYLAILHLLYAEYMLGNQEAARKHIYGLLQAETINPLSLRTDLFGRWLDILVKFTHLILRTLEGRDPTETSVAQNQPTYPTLPFSPELTESLAKLPDGFLDLAFAGLLSHESISSLQQVETVVIKSQLRSVTDSELETVARLVQRYLFETHLSTRLPAREQFLHFVLTMLVIQLKRPASLRLYEHSSFATTLETLPVFEVKSETERDTLIWLLLVLAGIRQHEMMRFLLDNFPQARDQRYLSKIVRKHFYTPAVEERWKDLWREVMEERAEGEHAVVSPSSDTPNLVQSFDPTTVPWWDFIRNSSDDMKENYGKSET